jgi:hypothetical protein
MKIYVIDRRRLIQIRIPVAWSGLSNWLAQRYQRHTTIDMIDTRYQIHGSLHRFQPDLCILYWFGIGVNASGHSSSFQDIDGIFCRPPSRIFPLIASAPHCPSWSYNFVRSFGFGDAGQLFNSKHESNGLEIVSCDTI